MKRSKPIRTLVLLAALGGLLALPAVSQKRGDDTNRASKNGLTEGKIGDVEVTLTYGRPKVKGREIWGKLVPYDKVWRAGADEATTITFSEDVTIEGEPLAAGTYALFLLPTQETWTVIFNKKANQWGAFGYDEKDDALRVEVEAEEAEHQEELTFLVEEEGDTSGEVVMHWEKLRVPFRVEVTG